MERNNAIVTRISLLNFILCLQQIEQVRASQATDVQHGQTGSSNSKPHTTGG